MSWNHRVLAFENEDETFLCIMEVQYDKLMNPKSYCEPVIGGDNTDDLKWVLKRMLNCLNNPVLSGDNFPDEYKSK